MLELRRAIVVGCEDPEAGLPAPGAPGEDPQAEAPAEQRLLVELATDAGRGQRRAAVADVALVGRAELGDELIINIQGSAPGPGSGGFDVVHVNLSRGLNGQGEPGAHPLKLEYTSLQHAVRPVDDGSPQVPLGRPAAMLALHGQLAAVAWAFAQRAPQARLGYVQTEGGALPGCHSPAVAMLRRRGLLAGHITAGAAFGGEREAITMAGALSHCLGTLGWDAAVCGPGPRPVGSGTSPGPGGMAALDSAHVALALGCPTLLVALMSSGDERARPRAISDNTLLVLDLLLEPVTVALPAGMRSPVGRDLRAGLGAIYGGAGQAGPPLELDVERPARIARHDWRRATVDLPAYAASGLSSTAVGRGPAEDPLFFASALAAGGALADLLVHEDAADGEAEGT